MQLETLFKLYQKEREYQKCCFGEYKDLDSLNLASFLLFIEEYLNKSKKGYCGPWKTDSERSEWLLNCKEMWEGSSPEMAYEELIKVFTLAGAALETFAEIDPEKWRENPEEDFAKWKK